MRFIEQVREKRKKLADVLVDDEYSGLRKLVEELYPDKAHFIYELLQNAEDTGAEHVKFQLEDSQLVFAHDGRSFTEEDVLGITNIGKGTKGDDEDKIGRFGVGFKAVFAYCETPSIWSPTFNFQISDLVLPKEIPGQGSFGQWTVFRFPFNNPKKSAGDAFAETAEGLESLSEELLIFLKNIKVVRWTISKNVRGKLKRVEHTPHLIEVQKYVDEKAITSSCFLRFSSPVTDLPTQNVSLAFPLERIGEPASSPNFVDVANHYRIVPAEPSRVSVYFPAEKEVSGLRFHLHAPFVPELSRASVKDTPANEPLFEQLAKLAASALALVRDLGLLTVDFLNVLPHEHDTLPRRYRCIAEAIVEAMNSQPLTPTQSKTHLPARRLLQAKAIMKELFPKEDLSQLVGEGSIADWAVAAPQRSSHADRFLSRLEIKRWDAGELVDLLVKRRNESQYWDANVYKYKQPELSKSFDGLFAGKGADWFQKFYSFLFKELSESADLNCLKSTLIVRLKNGEFSRPDKAFFSNSEADNASFPPVDPAVFSSGKNAMEQDASRRFLLAVGVREVGELEQVQAILDSHYGRIPARSFSQHVEDIQRFLKLIRSEPNSVRTLSKFNVILDSSEKWCRPSELFVDQPYSNTGLKAFYSEVHSAIAARKELSHRYFDAGFSGPVCEFAIALGAKTSLAFEEVTCDRNPNVDYLVRQAPGQPSRYQINRDYWLSGLDEALKTPSVRLARLLWKSLIEQGNERWTRAEYRNNQTQPTRESESRLAAFLRDTAWVPQAGGRFVIPADADDRSLPDDFEFARGWKWLSTISFGSNFAKRTEEYKKKKEFAVELGFEDDESLDDARWFAQLDPELRRQLMSEYQSRAVCELPEKAPVNLERRIAKVVQLANDAPEEEKEIRPRSVSTVTPGVKKEVRPYLRDQYTNSDGDMICQICKHALPFALANGDPFFETVVLVSETRKVHFQNFIALCPNHAAMFRHANESKERINELVHAIESNRLPLVMAGKDFDVYFTETHLADLRAVLTIENDGEPDSSDMSGAMTATQ